MTEDDYQLIYLPAFLFFLDLMLNMSSSSSASWSSLLEIVSQAFCFLLEDLLLPTCSSLRPGLTPCLLLLLIPDKAINEESW